MSLPIALNAIPAEVEMRTYRLEWLQELPVRVLGAAPGAGMVWVSVPGLSVPVRVAECFLSPEPPGTTRETETD